MITIALATFKEAVRKKIVFLIIFLTAVYLAVFSFLIYSAYNQFKEMGTGVFDIVKQMSGFVSILGFYFSGMIVAFLTIMASVGAVSSDIESGTIQSVVTKPLRRSEYVLGKFLGLAALTGAYSMFLYLFLIMLNIVLGIPPLCNIDAATFLKGLLLFVFIPLALLSLCIFGSVTLKTLNNGIVVISIYILGMVGGMMEQIGASLKIDSLFNWGIFISLVSPFDSIYRKMISIVFSSINIAAAYAQPIFLSGSTPSNWMTAYALAFSTAFILLALRKFNRRDIT